MPEGICIQLWHYQCSIHDPCSQNSITYLHQVAKELHHLRYFLINGGPVFWINWQYKIVPCNPKALWNTFGPHESLISLSNLDPASYLYSGKRKCKLHKAKWYFNKFLFNILFCTIFTNNEASLQCKNLRATIWLEDHHLHHSQHRHFI
jgi:hypothetical protein